MPARACEPLLPAAADLPGRHRNSAEHTEIRRRNPSCAHPETAPRASLRSWSRRAIADLPNGQSTHQTFLSMCKTLHAVRKKCYLPALRPSTHDPSTRGYLFLPVARDRARLPVEIVRPGQATRAKRQVDKDIAFPASLAQRLRSDIRGPLGPCRRSAHLRRECERSLAANAEPK